MGDYVSVYYPNRVVQNSLFDLTPAGATKRTVLAPDIALMRSTTPPPWDRVPKEPPLLAVEIVSDSQTLAELSMKAQFYRNAGVDEVWVIDHATRTIEVWNAGGMLTLTDGQLLTSTLLPGFSLDIATLLDG